MAQRSSGKASPSKDLNSQVPLFPAGLGSLILLSVLRVFEANQFQRKLKVPSRAPACVLKPVSNMFPTSDGGASLLCFKRKDLIWMCPQAADVIELFIYLGEPCHVCQLLLTTSHGADNPVVPGISCLYLADRAKHDELAAEWTLQFARITLIGRCLTLKCPQECQIMKLAGGCRCTKLI
ncbi:putative phosphoinositide phosphatase SAC9 [Camellia lanceoleosa]|uniref:Phosphoinositide phosphatase SAC9 n=1 Tax=Camellia lanceoleosa TaxID=1840588 RepID=A0ACC0I152_9ERIC|nr:putative phosphoinositide phosphatase SAC9 [Camellia lanceoleosa]